MGNDQVGKNTFVVWDDVLQPAELDAIEALGDQLVLQKAGLADKNDRVEGVRSTRIAWIQPNQETDALYRRIGQIVGNLNQKIYHFKITGIETMQYTVYESAEGGRYDWHIDYGPHNRWPRKISLSIQLSDPSTYEGCDLEFRIGPTVGAAPRRRGAIIAFPSFYLHRVSPILSGTRKALVIWANGPDFE